MTTRNIWEHAVFQKQQEMAAEIVRTINQQMEEHLLAAGWLPVLTIQDETVWELNPTYKEENTLKGVD